MPTCHYLKSTVARPCGTSSILLSANAALTFPAATPMIKNDANPHDCVTSSQQTSASVESQCSRLCPMRAVGHRLHSFPFHSWMLVITSIITSVITPPLLYATGCAKQLSIKVWLLKIPYNNQHLPWSPYSSQLIPLIQSHALRGAMTIDHTICWSNKPCTLNTHQCTWWLAWLTSTPQHSIERNETFYWVQSLPKIIWSQHTRLYARFPHKHYSHSGNA